MTKPKPCPFCGKLKIMAEGDDRCIAMVCQRCRAHGPFVLKSDGRKMALAFWNQRKPHPLKT